MGFRMGIVGLPNVGKSTLFNALTRTAAAQAANFPFCTIEPNVGEVAVPDARLDKLAAIAGSKQIIPTRMTFVDIAGLVRGASKGEGLGNQFLANIRECDAIAHVLRCFEDGDVTHVEGRIDPIADAETIETPVVDDVAKGRSLGQGPGLGSRQIVRDPGPHQEHINQDTYIHSIIKEKFNSGKELFAPGNHTTQWLTEMRQSRIKDAQQGFCNQLRYPACVS